MVWNHYDCMRLDLSCKAYDLRAASAVGAPFAQVIGEPQMLEASHRLHVALRPPFGPCLTETPFDP